MTNSVYPSLRLSSGRGRSVVATLWGRTVVPLSEAIGTKPTRLDEQCDLSALKKSDSDRAADDGSNDF